jgi:two-component system response regulator
MSGTNGRMEILLVEDNPTDAELCIRSLRKHNLTNDLYWVKDGAEALDFLFARGSYANHNPHRPKVVMLDLRLPNVEGLEVLRQIRTDEHLKTLPVVVLTSSKEDRDIAESYKRGANSFVSKPVEFDAFAKTVGDLGLYWVLVNNPPL